MLKVLTTELNQVIILTDDKLNFSKTGYLRNSPDVNKPVNYIEGGSITMKGVDFKVLAIPSNGSAVVMEPGKDYDFPGAAYVKEIPLK